MLMPSYKYSAVAQDGQLIKGVQNAGDRRQVVSSIRSQNQIPVQIDEIIEKKEVDLFAFSKKVKLKDLAIFCRQFYTMLNAGITIIKCLDILQQQTENKKLKQVISALYGDVHKGASLSEAMKNHRDVFPELLINMIEAGEVSGTLDNIMERMSVNYEKESKLSNKVKSAMIYPVVLIILSVVVVIFMLTFIMPTFTGMFEGSDVPLPGPTRFLMNLSDLVRNYFVLIVLVVAAIVYLCRKYINSDKGRLEWDRLKLRFPIVKGIVVKLVTSRFTRTVSSLLASGIPLLQAMEVTAKVVGNRVVSDGIMSAREDMRKGTDLAGPIKRIGVFPPMIDSMIRIGEESGTLDEILEKTANFYDEEVEVAMQKLVSLMEPIMIIFMALIVGFIVIAMMLPMFDMLKTIQ